MQIQPAKMDQVRRAADGPMILVDRDVGGVAEDLRRIDPHLKVRFGENGNPPFFAVYWESDDGRNTYLVKTIQAHQNKLGVWEGLDHRVVEEMQRIDPQGRGGYDYAKEVERMNVQAEKRKRERVREATAERGEELAHAIRKDLGLDKHRVFT